MCIVWFTELVDIQELQSEHFYVVIAI